MAATAQSISPTAMEIVMPEHFLVVDDHPMFLDAMKLAIRAAFPAADISEATSISDAAKTAADLPLLDMIVLDLSMPGTKGFEGLLELRTTFPKLPILIVSGMEDPQIIHQAMTYGAAGYMPKSVRKDELADAIRTVMSGEICLPPGYEPPPPGSTGSEGEATLVKQLGTLTPQQLRVLKMLREGLLNKQIAYQLSVGETTVKAHVSEILRKLNVASRTQAVIAVARIDFENITDDPHH